MPRSDWDSLADARAERDRREGERRATDAAGEAFDLDVWFLALADLADMAADALIIFADIVRDEA